MADSVGKPEAQASGSAQQLSHVVGHRIRSLRIEHGWSLSGLALKAELGKATLSELEAGRRNPTLETLYALAAQLEVPLADLLVEPGQPVGPTRQLSGKAVTASLVEVFDDPSAPDTSAPDTSAPDTSAPEGGVTTEVYRLVIRCGRRQVSPGHGPGVVEHLIVTAGIARVGPVDAVTEIQAGEHGHWDSSGQHEYSAVGELDVQAVLIIRHPRGRRALTSATTPEQPPMMPR
jgi:transcriptional regulator with XRE-family HTH domain